MSNTRELITAIVPFYQKSRGILLNSIKSALDQTVLATHELEIIVVDDGSPISATSELVDISLPNSCTLRIIRQENKGPAAARNRGLDEAESTTKYIAFLDSDDCWTENHLANAVKALGENADFYFSDFYQLDQKISAFNRAKRINLLQHQMLDSEHYLYLYKGDMITQIITGNIIGTPTVVYRFKSDPKLRFREEFSSAGEDYFFWIDYCSCNRKIVFSSLQECKCGRGVNIYTGAEWGSRALLDRILNELHYRKLSLTTLAVSKETKRFLQNKIDLLRLEFTQQIIHRLAHMKEGVWESIRKAYRVDAPVIFLMPLNTLRIFLKPLNRRLHQEPQ